LVSAFGNNDADMKHALVALRERRDVGLLLKRLQTKKNTILIDNDNLVDPACSLTNIETEFQVVSDKFAFRSTDIGGRRTCDADEFWRHSHL
jgi:hypothetical protein